MGQNVLPHASDPDVSLDENNRRQAAQLVWVLVTILILLYLATSYVYWAKLESAWPISH